MSILRAGGWKWAGKGEGRGVPVACVCGEPGNQMLGQEHQQQLRQRQRPRQQQRRRHRLTKQKIDHHSDADGWYLTTSKHTNNRDSPHPMEASHQKADDKRPHPAKRQVAPSVTAAPTTLNSNQMQARNHTTSCINIRQDERDNLGGATTASCTHVHMHMRGMHNDATHTGLKELAPPKDKVLHKDHDRRIPSRGRRLTQ